MSAIYALLGLISGGVTYLLMEQGNQAAGLVYGCIAIGCVVAAAIYDAKEPGR